MSDLFRYAASKLARTENPETSHSAAKMAAADKASDRALVLRVHAEHPTGLTDAELAMMLRQKQDGAFRKRRCDLTNLGFIAATEARRPTPSGATAIVWRITEAGMAAADK